MTHSLKEQALLNNGTHFDRAEVGASMVEDDELVMGRTKVARKSVQESEKRFRDAMDVVLDANQGLLDATISLEKQGKKSCASVKSLINQVKDQLIKVDNILGNNVETKVVQLERIASALATIKELSADQKTMAILSKMEK